jgi:DHA1 family bicyclomycin/chloramphenicol resistance-like MFS transporter
LAIAAIQTIWPLTMDLYLPAFPQIGTDLDTSVTMVQLTLTAAFLGMALGQLAAGPLSDRVGRSRPLCVALLLYFLAGAACAAAPSAEALVAARFLQGTGAAASAVIVVAMVRDTSSGAAMVRRSARLGLISGVFVVASPSLGAQLLGLTDWRGLFWLLTAYGAVLVLVAVVVLLPRETNPPARRALRGDAGLRDDLLVLARDRHYRATVAVAVLVWAAMMGYMASSAFLFQDAYGLGPQGYAVVFGGHGAVMILAAQLSARLARHHDLAAMFRGGSPPWPAPRCCWSSAWWSRPGGGSRASWCRCSSSPPLSAW